MFKTNKVLLQRTRLTKHGVRGVMYYESERVAHTLEKPWLNNQHNVSCIPVGEYRVKSDNTGRFKWWRLYGVANRGMIEIHEGNTIKDTLGCILVGNVIYQYDDNLAIKNSLKTLKYLKKVLPNSFILKIEEQDSRIDFKN